MLPMRKSPLTMTLLLGALAFGCDDDDDEMYVPTDASGSGSMDVGPGGSGDAMTRLADPAPGLDLPGKFTIPAVCPGCPTSADTQFEIQAGGVTARNFTGQVSNAVGNGVFFVSAGAGAMAQELSGPIATQPAGNFSFTAPLFCGVQIVKCVWSNAAGSYVLNIRVTTTNCVNADIRVTISWDELGEDWELHLIKPGGRINDDATDCTWTSCIDTGPDWGVKGDASDDPLKDVDDLDSYGPENIFLAKPENGRYTVMVEHWGRGSPMSDGQAIVNVRGQAVVFSIMDLAPQWVWTVATIDWPSGVVTPVGTVFDCSAMWSGGCNAPIP